MMKTYKKSNRGFALLFAVFTASILMLIGVSIFSVSLRELAISQSAKDSQLAFYAADSARECALYWDIKQAAFPYCLGDGCESNPLVRNPAARASITCNGNVINFTKDGNYTLIGNVYTFTIPEFLKYGDDTKPMADLSLIKTFNTSGPDTNSVTSVLNTQGHNTGPSGRRLERGILQNY